MIQAWRLVKTRRADSAFSGEGARIAGGRWNHSGTSVVYVSGALSLAMLELLVHLDSQARYTLDLVSIPVSFPARLVGTISTLPRHWRAEPAPRQTKDIGTSWVKSASSCVLQVPSVIVPDESNFVLNPAHPEFRRMEIGTPRPVSLDPRLWT